VCIYVYTYICMWIHIYIHVYMWVHTFVCVYMYTCMFIYTYVYKFGCVYLCGYMIMWQYDNVTMWSCHDDNIALLQIEVAYGYSGVLLHMCRTHLRTRIFVGFFCICIDHIVFCIFVEHIRGHGGSFTYVGFFCICVENICGVFCICVQHICGHSFCGALLHMCWTHLRTWFLFSWFLSWRISRGLIRAIEMSRKMNSRYMIPASTK